MNRERGKSLFVAAAFINNIGNGIFLASGALYFTRVIGLSVLEVGVGLSAAGVVGISAGVLVGRWADRFGARGVHSATMFFGAVAMIGYLLSDDFVTFLIFASLAAMVAPAAQASRAPLIRAFGGTNPAHFRAVLRSISNLAMAAGAGIAALGIASGSASAYRVLIAANGLSYLICAMLMLAIPSVKPSKRVVPNAGRRRLDRPFLAVTGVNGLIAIHFAIPTFALPLWIARDTAAPTWMISVLLFLNTGLVVLFQVAASRSVKTPIDAGRATVRAGIALATCVLLIGVATFAGSILAAILLTIGIVVYAFGEIWHTTAAYELTFGLAPSHAQGQYAGIFGVGQSAAQATAPLLLSILCIGLGWPGWVLLGAIFLAASLFMPKLIAWSIREHPTASNPAPRL